MIQATDFEFRNRWWLFGLIFGAGFFLLAIDHVPIGSRLADRLAAAAQLPESTALHIVFGVSAVIMLVAALVRAWGSAYLGREVVHDHAIHSEALKADGPYRHVRNPLYFGNVLMSWAVGLFAPLIGWPLMVIGIPIFCYRLIGREEAALEAEQGRALSRLQTGRSATLALFACTYPGQRSQTRLEERPCRRSLFHFLRARSHRLRDLAQRSVVLCGMAGFSSAELAGGLGCAKAQPADRKFAGKLDRNPQASPPWRESFSASMAAPRAPALSPCGITRIGISACSSRWVGIPALISSINQRWKS